MSAKSIKGITVEINGDARGLGEVLKDVDKQAVNASSSLKTLNRLLKLDPTNTELLAEKQKILADAIEASKEKLKTLESVQDQISQQYASGDIDRGAYLDFQNEIIRTRQRLEELEAQQREFGSVAKQEMEAVAQKVKEVGKELEAAGEKVSGLGDKVTNAGEKLLPVTGAITAASAAAVKYGSDLEESQNKVDVAFQDSADEVKRWAETTIDCYGIAEGTALDKAALFGDMATSMQLIPGEAAKMAISLVGLAADLSSFKNIEIEVAQNALKGVFTGETESLKSLGIVMTETNLLQYALQNGFIDTAKSAQQLEKEQLALEKAQTNYNNAVKKYGADSLQAREAALKVSEAQERINQSVKGSLDSLTTAEMVQLRYSYVVDATANAQGDFARTSDGAANSMRVCQEAVKEVSASFGTLLTPYVAAAAKEIATFLKGIAAMPEEQKRVVLSILAVVAAIGPLLVIGGTVLKLIGSTVSAIGTILQAAPMLVSAISAIGTGISGIVATVTPMLLSALSSVGTAFSSLFAVMAANPIVWITALITALIAALVALFVYLWNNSEAFRQFWVDLGNSVKQFCASAYESIAAWCSNTATSITSWCSQTYSSAVSWTVNLAASVQQGFAQLVNSVSSAFASGWAAIQARLASWPSYFDGLVDRLRSAFSNVLSIMTAPFTAAANFIHNQIERIKSFFNFEWSLPRIKLPHFSINGRFNLNPPSVPSFDVSWYAKGGILTAPTIFGAMGGDLLGGGEMGREAVLPLSEFYRELESIMTRNFGGSNLIVNLNIDHFENSSGQDVDELAEVVAERIQHEIDKERDGL